MFKFGDHVIRRLAKVMYSIEPIRERCEERIKRSYGVVTAQQVMTYLTDRRRTDKPMTREDAHNLTATLATEAYENKTNFADILLSSEEITSRFDEDTVRAISEPLTYVGKSEEIIRDVFKKYHGKKTLK